MRTSSEAKTIEALLPETLPENVTMNLVNSVKDDLGGKEFLLFRRESWCNSFDYEIGYPLTDEEEKPRWASWCRCGACGEEWHSGWARKKRLIPLLVGEQREAIQTWRKSLGLTQRAAGALLGVTGSTVSHWEAGEERANWTLLEKHGCKRP